MRGQFQSMRTKGYQVSFISSRGKQGELQEVGQREDVDVYELDVSREIDPVRDVAAMGHMSSLLIKVRPDIINYGNPKTGMVASLAATILGTSVRIYTLHGLRLETATGVKRRILWYTEWLTMQCSHQVVAVSESLRARAIELGLVPEAKIIILHRGSVNGIQPLTAQPDEVERIRAGLQLPKNAVVMGFVGRFTRDKGVRELVEAFLQLRQTNPEAHLLLVGDYEEGDPVDQETRRQIQNQDGIVLAGYAEDVAPYYALMDVVVLPTYREGFPTVALEAASMGLPLISTDATGARDAVQDGVTGLQVPVGDITALHAAMLRLVIDPDLRTALGERARAWIVQDYSQERLWNEWHNLYQRLLAERRSIRFGTWHRRAGPAMIGGLGLAILVRALRKTREYRGKKI